MTESEKGTSRRQILHKAVGGLGTGALGFPVLSTETEGRSGTGLAEKKMAEAQKQYNSTAAVKKALKTKGETLLKTLAEEDILRSPVINELPVEEILDLESYLESDEGMLVAAKINELTPTAEIKISKQTPTHKVLLTVYPQTDTAYAIVEPNNDNRTIVYDPSEDVLGKDISTSACMVGNQCGPYDCDLTACSCATMELHCCSEPNCWWGDFVQSKCKTVCCYTCENVCFDDGCCGCGSDQEDCCTDCC